MVKLDAFVSDIKKSRRFALCLDCDNEFRLALADEDCICDEYGEEIEIMEECCPEEFIWHPGKMY